MYMDIYIYMYSYVCIYTCMYIHIPHMTQLGLFGLFSWAVVGPLRSALDLGFQLLGRAPGFGSTSSGRLPISDLALQLLARAAGFGSMRLRP